MTTDRPVYVTRGLLDALVELAEARDPDSVTVLLSVSPAGDLEGAPELSPETPVFTDLYLPTEQSSINAVFGVDMTTPPRQSQGRFISHPLGELDVSLTDDLHEVMLVATPPWTRESVGAFDRRGRRRSLTVLDATPPEERLDDGS